MRLKSLDAAAHKRATRRYIACETLLGFAKYTAPPEYQWWKHHELLYSQLDKIVSGETKRLIIEMPPGVGKSESVSRNLPSYVLGKLPNHRIIATSYTQDLASEMNRDVQRIMDSEPYQQLFPGRKLGEDNADVKSSKPRRNSKMFDIPGFRGTYKAAGVGGPIGGYRFDLGIIDDPIKNREQANSPVFRESVWRWFTSTFMKRQAKNAAVLITSTRWHEDDLVGRIKRKMTAGEIEPFQIITLPALANDVRPDYDWRQPGEALWPWFRSVAELEMMRRTEPRDFFALEQQDPRGEGASEWGPECFPASIYFDDWPKDLQFLTLALDPSKGKNASHGDYSALVALGRTPDGMLWVEADLARRDVTRMVDASIEFANRIHAETKIPIEGFGIESDQFQELIADQIAERAGAEWFSGIVRKMLTKGVPKEVRIRRLTSSITGHKIRFRATPSTRLLVRQLEQFPNADHDDGPDALEYAHRLANELWTAGKAEYGADYASLQPESRW